MSTLPTADDLLDATEEIDLARAMEAGLLARAALQGGWPTSGGTVAELRQLCIEGEQARERYVLANLRLVTLVAQRAARQSGLEAPELFQEGIAGLITAVDRFDHDQGVRFATYALPWIRAFVARAVANRCGELPVSDSRAARRRTVRTAWQRLMQERGREPSLADVAAATGLPEPTARDLLLLEPPCSLVDETGAIVDPPDPRASLALEAVLTDRPAVAEWIGRLPPLEQRVVRLRFGFAGEPRSHTAVAKMLGLSKTTVRRVENRALERLRAYCPTSAATHLAG